jgi:CBS domain-containing protein
MSLARFKSPLATVGAEDTVEKAAQLMRERRVGCLVVTRSGRPLGLVTDRDIVIRVVAEGRDARTDKVGDFATYDPITVSVHEGIETVVARMRRHGVRRLPVVDEDGMAVGIVTADDLLVLLGGEIAGVCEGIENRADAEDSR